MSEPLKVTRQQRNGAESAGLWGVARLSPGARNNRMRPERLPAHIRKPLADDAQVAAAASYIADGLEPLVVGQHPADQRLQQALRHLPAISWHCRPV